MISSVEDLLADLLGDNETLQPQADQVHEQEQVHQQEQEQVHQQEQEEATTDGGTAPATRPQADELQGDHEGDAPAVEDERAFDGDQGRIATPFADGDADDELLDGIDDLLDDQAVQAPMPQGAPAQFSASSAPSFTAPGGAGASEAASSSSPLPFKHLRVLQTGPQSSHGSAGQWRGGGGSQQMTPSTSVRMAIASSLTMHEMLLEEAEAAEQSLLLGPGTGIEEMSPMDQVDSLLAGARQDWPPQGRPDATGAMVGGSVALKLEEVCGTIPDLAVALGVTIPQQQTLHGGQLQHSNASFLGVARVVSLQGTVLAVGTSLGVTLVAQLPSISTAAAATAPDGSQQQPQQQQPQPMQALGEPRSEAEAVTALGFSRMEAPADPLWLLVGHASGAVVVWDLQRRPVRCVTTITGQHGLPVTHASFLPGRGVAQALTSDRRGRLVSHTLSHNLLLMRTTAASRALLDGSLGIISAVVHLQPFAVPWPQQQHATSLTSHSSLPGAPEFAVARDARGPVAPALPQQVPPPQQQELAGDGMLALCAPTGCHVARLRSNGELQLLTVVPRPEGVRQGTLPAAAWAQHTRQGFVPAVATAPLPGLGSVGDVPELMCMPCASLAVAWDDVVSFCKVPLLGDHRSQAGSATVGSGAEGTGVAQAAAAQVVGRSLLRTVTAAAAATATRAAGGSAADALTPGLVKQLMTAFPLQVLRHWRTSALDEQEGGRAAPAHPSAAGAAQKLHVLALHWYDGDALGVVVLQGLQMRLAVIGPDLELREQVDCFDTPLPSSSLTTASSSAPCCPESICGQGSRVLLLGANGTLYCSRLMGWQERLRTLQDVGKAKLALWYGFEFYKMQQAMRQAGGAPPMPDAQAQQLTVWLVSLLTSHARDVLHEAVAAATGATGAPRGWAPPPQLNAIRRCAALCICCCLTLQQQQPLFQQVFTLFQQAERALLGAAGAPVPADDDTPPPPPTGLARCSPLAAFLEALEPHILTDRLPSLAPEVVQALVEHFAAGGQQHGGAPPQPQPQPQRVERCVLHLDVFTLDLDQVLRLCTAHGLYSALVYVHNRINEYRQPAFEMLACLAGFRPAPQGLVTAGTTPAPPTPAGALATARAPLVAVARKLLVYLRCTFRGQAFPPGSGALGGAGRAAQAAGGGGLVGLGGMASELRAQLLGLLLFTDTKDLAREWQQPLAAVEAVVSDPYPALQLLLAADAAATVSVLGEAVDGWDAVETELRMAAGKPPVEAMDSVLVATQVLVNALVTLMDRPLPVGRAGVMQGAAAAHATSSSPRTATLDFVTSLVTARRVTVQPHFVLLLLQHVLAPPPGSGVLRLPVAQLPGGFAPALAGGAGALGGAQGAVTGTPTGAGGTTGQMAGGRQWAGGDVQPSGPAEQLAICMLDVVGINAVQAVRQAPDKLSPQESQQAIQLLLHHGMRLAAAHAYHMRGEVQQALAMHLLLPDKAAPFLYIYGCLSSGHAPARAALTQALLQVGRELAVCDAAATAAAALALQLSAEQQMALLAQVEDEPVVKFQLLQTIMALTERLAQDAWQHGDAEPEDQEGAGAAPRPTGSATPLAAHPAGAAPQPTAPPVGGSGSTSPWGDAALLVRAPLVTLLLPPGSPAVPRPQDLRQDGRCCDAYVLLCCRCAPASVLPFLLCHAAYDVRRCLAAVREAQVKEAQAYLLERLGELRQAFQLHLSRIQESSEQLEAALPPPAHDSARVAVGQAPAPAPPVAPHGHGTDGLCAAGGSGSVHHLVWLLRLEPRLRTSLQHICGEQAYREALQLYDATLAAAHPAGAAVAPALLPAAPGIRADHCSAPSSGCGSAPAAHHLAGGGGGGGAAAGGAPAGQQVLVSRRLSGWGAAGQVAPWDMAAAAVPPVPHELEVFWGALLTTLGFCQRVSRTEKLQREHLAMSKSPMHAAAPTASKADPGPVPGAAAAAAAASKLHRQQQGEDAGADTAVPPAAAMQDSAELGTAAVYWLELLEVYIRHMRTARAGRPPGAGAVALEHVFAAAVDEVVGAAADHVLQLTDLVRHISDHHGGAAVGEFRGLLAGLLSACSYEQAIMRAALRLVSHDALAHVRKRLMLQARCLAGPELTHVSRNTDDDDDGRATASAGGASGHAGGRVAAATGAKAAQAGGARWGQGASNALALVTDRVHSSLLSKVAMAGGGGRRGEGASARAPASGSSGGAALMLESLGKSPALVLDGGLGGAGEGSAGPALDPRPALEAGMAGLRGCSAGHVLGRAHLTAAAAGRAPDFQEMLVGVTAGAGASGPGTAWSQVVRARVDVAAVLRGLGLRSTGRAAGSQQGRAGRGKQVPRSGPHAEGSDGDGGTPGTPGRADVVGGRAPHAAGVTAVLAGGLEASPRSFDVDDLLRWTADVARA